MLGEAGCWRSAPPQCWACWLPPAALSRPMAGRRWAVSRSAKFSGGPTRAAVVLARRHAPRRATSAPAGRATAIRSVRPPPNAGIFTYPDAIFTTPKRASSISAFHRSASTSRRPCRRVGFSRCPSGRRSRRGNFRPTRRLTRCRLSPNHAASIRVGGALLQWLELGSSNRVESLQIQCETGPSMRPASRRL